MTSQPIRLSTNFMTLTPSLTVTDYEWFPWSICNGCGMPAGNAYPSGHLVPSPILGLANAPIIETKFLVLAMSLLDFSPRIPLGTFSILLQKYCETAYSRNGINQMWILKNSKELLDRHKSPNFNLITNIKSFDFSTLYTTIPNQKLKSRLATIIRNSFIHKNGNQRYKYLVFGREGPYFVLLHLGLVSSNGIA